jgi:glycine hydroxymethyltransferase
VLELLEMLSSQQYHKDILNALKEQDPQIYKLLSQEYERVNTTLQLIAAENQCSQAVLAALGSIIQNKTTEGFPGSRFHGGCEIVDDIEKIAAARARETFDAQYANVQPHSGTSANQIVITAVLEKDDTILSLGMDQGGHVSHGANVSFSGKFFKVYNYTVTKSNFLLDYEAIKAMAIAFKPKLIICGATAYSRIIDFKKFREIADRVGAYLLADISHIAGLVIAGAHPSPVNYAHFTTTSTYKPGGPRGGLILMGHDFDRTITISGKDMPLWKLIDKTTFPGVQGTPYLNNIAAKAVFFNETLSEQYRARQFKIIENAKRLANNLVELDYDVLTSGTDNHMVLINISNSIEGLTGLIAQQCLEDCGIIINMNKLPYDNKNAKVTSGIRLGTPIVTKNGMGPEEIDTVSTLIDTALRKVKVLSENKYEIDDSTKNDLREKVRQLCLRFPLC